MSIPISILLVFCVLWLVKYSMSILWVFHEYSMSILSVFCTLLLESYFVSILWVFCKYSMSILCVFRKFSLQVTTLLVCTGAPSLHQTQLYVKRLKVLAGGYPVQNVLEFKQLCIPLLMPPNASDLLFAADGGVVITTPSRMFVIPLQASDLSVSGEWFTGPMQIKWIGELGKMPFKFV